MTEITVKNFQSIAEANITVDGFTVIVGRSNLGKSALIRAIDALLTNPSGDEFVRLGEKETSVQMTREGLDVLWHKKNSASYLINGVRKTKLNRAVPQELTAHGLGQLEIGGEKLDIQVAHQFEELFLLNRGKTSTVTDVLSNLYNLDVLGDADDLCQKDLRASKTLLKTRGLDISAAEEALKKYEGFDDLKVEAERLVVLEQKINTLKAEIALINKYEEALRVLKKSVDTLKGVLKVTIPESTECSGALEIFKWVSEKLSEYSNLTNRVVSLQPCHKVAIPEMLPGDSLNAIRELQGYEIELGRTSSLISSLDRVHKISCEFDTSSLESLSNSVSHIKGIEAEFLTSARSTKEARDTLKTTTEELKGLQEEYAKIKVCPYCEKPL